MAKFRLHQLTPDEKHQAREAKYAQMRNPDVADVVEQNIDKLLEMRRTADDRRAPLDKFADAITTFAGDMRFLYLHMVWFGVWIWANVQGVHVPGIPKDPYPFGLLTMIVSLEAIFLSTLVMISQNRMQAQSDERNELDLHINLLTEYEVTRVLVLVDAIADKMGCVEGQDPELDELKKVIAPEKIIQEIEDRERVK